MSFQDGTDASPRDAEAVSPSTQIHSSDPRLYPKRRVAVACNVCRIRKTRCDAIRPTCGFCKSIQAQCTWPDNRNPKQTLVAAEALVALEKRLAEVEQKLDSLALSQQSARPCSSNGASSILSPQTPNTSDSHHCNDQNCRRSAASRGFYEYAAANRRLSQRSGPDFSFRQTQAEAMTARPSLLTFRSPPFIKVNSWDDTTDFYDNEIRTGEWFHRQFEALASQAPDLTSRTTRRLQQKFVENCLTWTPIFDEAACVEIFNRAYASSFAPSDTSSCLALFLFALGEISDHGDTITEEIPGMLYFAHGSRMLERFSMRTGSIPVLQCRILQASYFKFAVCPLQAWNAISPAARDCMHILTSKTWTAMSENEGDRETMIRAFWATSIIIHELEATMKMHPIGLRHFHEIVPLPRFEEEDLAFYYFLAQITLRKFLTETLEVVGYHAGRIINAPVVTGELRNQAKQWYSHLPSAIRFPLDSTPLFDTRKSFLRCQYFGLFVVFNWPAVLQVMEYGSMAEAPPVDAKAIEVLKEGAQECLSSSVLFVSVAQEQLMGRRVGTHFSIWATYAMLSILLITFNCPALSFIPETKEPQNIRNAFELLQPWGNLPMLKKGLARARQMMQLAGL